VDGVLSLLAYIKISQQTKPVIPIPPIKIPPVYDFDELEIPT